MSLLSHLPNPTQFLLKFAQPSRQTTASLTKRIAQANAQLAPDVRLEFKDNYLTVWLTRAEKRNALSFSLMDKLIWLAKQLQNWHEVRAVILAGEGKSFCAGIDLADLNNKKNLPVVAWELLKPSQSKFQKVCLAWRDLPMPVIAVVQGHCIGAGLQLALACDVRFATPDCQFAIMEAKWGLVADMGITQSGFGVLRSDVVKELAMTARVFDGKMALDYGLVTHVSDNPMADAQALITELSQHTPSAVTASKSLINQMYCQSPVTLYHEKLWQIQLLIKKFSQNKGKA